MVRKTSLYGDKTYGYFVCAAHRADKSVCSSHSISEEKLEKAVLEGINFHIRAVAELRGALEAISRRPMQRVTLERIDRRLEALQQELAKKQEIRDSLYRRYACGEVSKEDFYDFKRIFTKDCDEVELAIEYQKRQLDELLTNTSPGSPWIEYFRRFGQIDTLVRDVLVRLVERIMIYEDNRIEIVFRYQAQFDQAKAAVASFASNGELREAV